MPGNTVIQRIFRFYSEGFSGMTVGKKLWWIILIKLFVLFVILRIFFFHDFLDSKFSSESDKSEYVLDQLTK
jgi:hypothetical protein